MVSLQEQCAVIGDQDQARSHRARALPDGSTAPPPRPGLQLRQQTGKRGQQCGLARAVPDRAAPQSHPRRSTDPGHVPPATTAHSLRQPAALQNAHGCTFLVSTVVAVVSPGAPARGRRAQVGTDDGRIAAHLVRGAGRDHPTEIENDDAVADSEHQIHVVVDEQHRDPAVTGRPPPLPEPLAFQRIESGRRFVEQRHPRSAGQHPRHRDQLPLPWDGSAAPTSASSEMSSRASAARTDSAPWPPLWEAPTMMFSATVSSSYSSMSWNVRPSPARARRCGARPPTSRTGQRDTAGRGDETTDRVHKGRLAGSVGTDQTDDLTVTDLEGHVVDRGHRAVANTDGGGREQHPAGRCIGGGRDGSGVDILRGVEDGLVVAEFAPKPESGFRGCSGRDRPGWPSPSPPAARRRAVRTSPRSAGISPLRSTAGRPEAITPARIPPLIEVTPAM